MPREAAVAWSALPTSSWAARVGSAPALDISHDGGFRITMSAAALDELLERAAVS
jgi:hypothetical protein